MRSLLTRTLWLVLLPLLLMAAAGRARAENVYIMDLYLNGIYSVDINTGGPATLLTPINPPANPQGYTLATRPSDGVLFYLDSSGTNPNLWRWDPATPTVAPVLVGTPGATTTDVVRLGFDSADNLIAMDTTTNMWTLDTGTGGILTQTPLSGDKPAASGDLCLNTTTGVLYMVANQNVYTVTSAGVSTLLGTITGLGVTGVNGYVTGCAFTHDGTMLISLYQGGNLRKLNLATLAATSLPTSTGMTAIGDLSTAPQRSADLRLTKTASNSSPGATSSFTVTVTNDGPVRASDVRVLDAVPAGLTVTSFTASQGTYSTSTVSIYPAGTWRLGGLAVGASATLVMSVDVSGSTAVTNTAQISYADQYDPDSTPNNSTASEDDQASVLVTPSPDLTLSKTANGSFTVGLNGSYSITASNAGSSSTSGVYTIVDVLPATLTYVSASGTGWSCSNAAGTVTCTSSTIIGPRATNPNAITLTVTPGAGAAPTVTNTASISGGGEPASNNGNNTSTVGNVVCSTSCPDLRPNKSLSVSTMTVGTTVTYSISVTNVGGTTTGTATYTLSDPLPTGLTLYSVPAAGAGWSCPASAPNNVVGGTGVLCTRSTALVAGATSTTVTFVVNVLNTAVPQVVNTATASGGGEPPTANGNNTASVTTTVNDFDLGITKAAGSLAVGATSTYTFTVANSGSRATTGSYSFTDDLPAGLTIRSSTPTNWVLGTGWTCAANGDQAGANTAGNSHIFCTRSTSIPIGGTSTTVVVPVSVAAAAAPSVTNTVNVVGAAEAPANTGNNSFSLTTAVTAPDLAVTKSHNGSFAVGVTATYTVTVTNIGQMTTSGTVTMVDTLPTGLTYVSAVGTNWTCSFASPNVTCTRTTVIPDNTSAPPVVISVLPTAAAAAASPVVNSVTVAGGNEPAGNNGNNSATDSTVISYPPVLAKSFSPASVPAGGTSTLTLTVTNPAGGSLSSITGVAITDPFPAGMAIASPPSVVNTCGFTVNSGGSQGDTLVDVAGGATGGPGASCLISFRVVATGTLGTLTNTTGAVRSANAGTGNIATATLVVTAPGSPVLTKVTSPNPVGVGENSVLTFTISNKASATTDMGFRDTLPSGLVVAPSGAFGGTCASTSGTALGRVGAPGTSTLTITGVDLGASASCTVTIPVRSTVAGTFTNTTSNISNLLGGLTAATVNDTLVVEAVGLSKTFSPSTIVAGNTSTMALVLTNGPGLAEQNNIAFTETLPAGVVLSSAPVASQCGGSITGTAGGGTLAVSGATLAAGLQTCTITATVTASAAGAYNNAAANISGLSINLVNNVTATLTVTPPPGPNLTKTNGVSSITPGDTTTYVITMSNTSGAAYTGGTAAVLKDPAVANLTLTSAACAAQGGATCPALPSAAMITALQSASGMTVSSMPNNSTIVLTVTATLSGNPTGTLTNVATATSGGGVTTVQDSDAIVYPSLSSTKTVAVLRDPVNGTNNPKSIPGSESLYTISVSNSGLGRVDDGTIGIVDPIPPNTALFVNSLGGSPAGPVTFADSGSNLTLAYAALNSAADDVDFSSDGGTTWAYTPVPDGAGYDAAVTHIRVRPRGRMAGWSGAGPFPSFSIAFKVKLN